MMGENMEDFFFLLPGVAAIIMFAVCVFKYRELFRDWEVRQHFLKMRSEMNEKDLIINEK